MSPEQFDGLWVVASVPPCGAGHGDQPETHEPQGVQEDQGGGGHLVGGVGGDEGGGEGGGGGGHCVAMKVRLPPDIRELSLQGSSGYVVICCR